MVFQFESIKDFFWMDGHGPYVWSAYTITFMAILILILQPLMAKKKFFKQQKRIAVINEENKEDRGE